MFKMSSLVLCWLFYLGVCNSARSASWSEAILKVEALQDEYSRAYKARTGFISIGTAYNGIDASMHRCAIVDRMLGLTQRVAQFEPPLPDLSSAPDQELAYAVGTLDSWLSQAGHLRGIPRSAKMKIWNLECASVEGLADTFWEEGEFPDKNEFYELSDDGEVLLILGPISSGFYDRFVEALEKNRQIKSVGLGSPGGAVVEAMKAGRLIRKRGIETTQYANCYSACPIVFLGGVRRTVWDGTRMMGFHEISIGGRAVKHDDPIYGLLYRYIIDMGANPKEIMKWMWSASPDKLLYKQWDDLCLAGVATFVYHGCLSKG